MHHHSRGRIVDVIWCLEQFCNFAQNNTKLVEDMKYGLEKNHGKIIAITSYLNKGKKQADHYIASAKIVVVFEMVLHFGNKPKFVKFVRQLMNMSRYKLNHLTHAHAKIPILIV